MPHVFTLEGLTDAQLHGLGADPVNFPEAGQPLAPHQAIVGPTRVAPMVFGPGGTPIMYRHRYPARGPVCDYCDPHYFTSINGGQTVIPYRRQLGDVEAFLEKQTPAVSTSIVAGGALLVGAGLATFGVWLYHKVGYRSKRAASGWGGWKW